MHQLRPELFEPADIRQVLAARAFPHWVDCRPIDLLRELSTGGFRVTKTDELSLWALPVVAARAVPKESGR